MNRQDFTLSGLQFQYVAPPSAYVVSPRTGPSVGGTTIAVQGDHFSADASLEEGTRCLFTNSTVGEDVSHVVSSRLMRCETPAASEPGGALLELSVNGLDHTSDLQTFRYVPSPEVEGAYPLVGSEAGGGVVVVYGSFLFDSDDVSCRVGTIAGIRASLVTADEISCLMPSHAPGPTQLDVTLNGRDHTREELLYDYERRFDVIGPVPTRVLAEGGGEVSLSFWPSDTDAALACVVDSTPVPASKAGPGTITCITPPHAPGFAALDVQMADAEVVSLTSVTLEYQVTPVVAHLGPRAGVDAGVAVIKVAGRHLVGDDVFCRIGHDDVVSATRVSSALAKCEAPAHARSGRPRGEHRRRRATVQQERPRVRVRQRDCGGGCDAARWVASRRNDCQVDAERRDERRRRDVVSLRNDGSAREPSRRERRGVHRASARRRVRGCRHECQR